MHVSFPLLDLNHFYALVNVDLATLPLEQSPLYIHPFSHSKLLPIHPIQPPTHPPTHPP